MVSLKGRAAICGLGVTDIGKIYGRDALSFASEAVTLALRDAGLRPDQLDGLLINSGVSLGLTLNLQAYLGLPKLRLLNHMSAYGATAGSMVQFAATAVEAGMAQYVACVFADAPLVEGDSSGGAYGGAALRLTGMRSLWFHAGVFGPLPHYAMAARRHMTKYGTTSDQLGSIAVQTREWAVRNPRAQMRTPITLEDYRASRWVCEPFHLLDCCLISNGGVAVIVTTAERARDLRPAPVYIHGFGQGHVADTHHRDTDTTLTTGAVESGRRAMGMAGITPADVDIREIYDCYTYTVLVTLEDYGFCKKGEGGELAASGCLGPGGALPTNTGGGQLSGFYMWGMTPLAEAVIQARGEGGERQVKKNDVILVSGNGGLFNHHATLVVSPRP